MTIDELVLFGTISKPFSFRGQLIVYSNFNSISSKTVFVKIDDSYVPFKLVNSSSYKKIFSSLIFLKSMMRKKLKVL